MPVLFIGTVYTALALPHLVALWCCRRVAVRSVPPLQCVSSYGIALILGCAIVARVSAGASVAELVEFFVPFCLVVLVWWAAVFFPIRRARGVSRITILTIPALFVPSVFVCTFFTTILTYKWHIGNFADRVQIELDVASAFLWPSWLVVAFVLAIYTWTPFARRRDERLQCELLHLSPERARGVSPVEHDPNPYSPPRALLRGRAEQSNSTERPADRLGDGKSTSAAR